MRTVWWVFIAIVAIASILLPVQVGANAESSVVQQDAAKIMRSEEMVDLKTADNSSSRLKGAVTSGKKTIMRAIAARVKTIKTVLTQKNILKKVLWGAGTWGDHYLRRLIAFCSAAVGTSVAWNMGKSQYINTKREKAPDIVQGDKDQKQGQDEGDQAAAGGDEDGGQGEEKIEGMAAWYEEMETNYYRQQEHRQELMTLVSQGNLEAVRRALEQEDVKRAIDSSVLSKAIERKYTEIAKLLIVNQAPLLYPVDYPYQDGPLCNAIEVGDHDLVIFMLQREGAELINWNVPCSRINENGRISAASLLYLALEKGRNIEIVRMLRKRGARLQLTEKNNLRMNTIATHNDAMIREILSWDELGVNRDFKREMVECAVRVGHGWSGERLRGLLVEHVTGEPEMRADMLEFALRLAIETKNGELANVLMAHSENVLISRLDVWRSLVKEGTEISLELAEEWSKFDKKLSAENFESIIFYIVEQDRYDFMQLFIDKDQDAVLSMVDSSNAALLDAAVYDNAEIVGRMLIKAGARMNEKLTDQKPMLNGRLISNEAINRHKNVPGMIATVLRYKKTNIKTVDERGKNVLQIVLENKDIDQEDAWSKLVCVSEYADAQEAASNMRWDKIPESEVKKRTVLQNVLENVLDGKYMFDLYKFLNPSDRLVLREGVGGVEQSKKSSEQKLYGVAIVKEIKNGIVGGLMKWVELSNVNTMGLVVDYLMPMGVLDLLPWQELRRAAGLEGETIEDEIEILKGKRVQEQAAKAEQMERDRTQKQPKRLEVRLRVRLGDGCCL